MFNYLRAFGWVWMFFHLFHCRKLGYASVGELKCSELFFQLSYNSLFSGYGFCEARLIPTETSSHPALGWWEASGFFFFFCHDEREKKVQYLNPPSLSHVQASICMSCSHVIIPFCSGCCYRVVPPLLASFFFLFQLHCTTYTTESCMEDV